MCRGDRDRDLWDLNTNDGERDRFLYVWSLDRGTCICGDRDFGRCDDFDRDAPLGDHERDLDL